MEWRDIPGFEGHYKISEYGDVMSCERVIESARHASGTKRLKSKVMKVQVYRGYRTICLRVGNKVTRAKIHHLVAAAFIGPWPEGAECVRHRDDVRLNNHYSNLVYGTIAQNVADSIRFGTFTRGERNGRAKLTNRQVAGIKRRLFQGARTRDLAEQYGVSQPAICDIKAERNWAHIEPASQQLSLFAEAS